jgi:hypothetical protein
MIDLNMLGLEMRSLGVQDVGVSFEIPQTKYQNDNAEKRQNVDFGPAVIVGPLFVMTPDGVLHSRVADSTYSPKIDVTSYIILPAGDDEADHNTLSTLGDLY